MMQTSKSAWITSVIPRKRNQTTEPHKQQIAPTNLTAADYNRKELISFRYINPSPLPLPVKYGPIHWMRLRHVC